MGLIKLMDKLSIFDELSELVILQINSCNEVVQPNSWIERRQHKDYDLWCIQEGQVEINIHENVYTASAGDVILFSPKIAYTATTQSNQCRFIYTHFHLSLGNQQQILDHFQLAGIFDHSLAVEEIRLFTETYNQYKQHIPMSEMRLKGFLTILLSKMMEQHARQNYQGNFIQQTAHQKQTKYLDKLQSVFHFVHKHLHLPIRVKELAAIAGMSEKYFIIYFKQTLGVTPGHYIYQLKMNRARELLYTKCYSIQQIANMLGYPDPYSFSKAFKKYYNVPPSEFV